MSAHQQVMFLRSIIKDESAPVGDVEAPQAAEVLLPDGCGVLRVKVQRRAALLWLAVVLDDPLIVPAYFSPLSD